MSHTDSLCFSGSSRIAALAFGIALTLASCGGGGSDAAPAPTPLALPNLASASASTLTVGAEATISFTNSGGGSLTNCAFSGALPTGLAVSRAAGNGSCRITGRPTAATSGAVTITVTATNATGADATPATVSITVNAAAVAPPTLSGVAAANVAATTAGISLTSSAAGTAYVAVLADGAAALADAAAVKGADAASADIVATGSAAAAAGSQVTVPLAGLAAGTMYDAYVVVEAGGVFSAVQKVDLQTAAVLASPDLANFADTTIAVGGTASIVFANSGGAVAADGCALAAGSTLPMALALGHATPVGASPTCQITGMAAAATDGPVTVAITAANATGRDMASVVITVSDQTPPTLSGVASAGVGHDSATFALTSDEGGTAHILLLSPHGAGDSLSAADVVARASASPLASGDFGATKAVSGGAAATIEVDGLAVSTAYSAYIVVRDAAGNDSPVDSSLDITTSAAADTTPPAITGVSVSDVRAASATLNLTSDDAGSIAAVALPAADSAPGSAADIKGHASAITGAAVAMTASTVSLTGLSAGTGYKAHFVVTNGSGMDSVVTSTDAFTTNNAPVADAGDGQSVAHDATVTLDGSGSSDADAGDTLEYAWAQTAGTTVTLSDAAVASPTFDAGDASDAGETLSFELTVTDGKDSDTDTVDVVVAAAPPTLSGVVAANVAATTAGISLTSSAAGTAYVAVLADGATAPADAAAVKGADAASADIVATGSVAATAGSQVTVPLAGLAAGTMYDAYVVVEAGGMFSGVEKVDLLTAAAVLASPDLANFADTTIAVGGTANIVFVNSGGAVAADGCALAAGSALPMGLALGHATPAGAPPTCQITGMAAAATDGPVTVAITATNATDSDMASVVITITVSDQTPPTLSGVATDGLSRNSATFTLTSSEDGTAYILLLSPRGAGDSLPAADVVARASASPLASGDLGATKAVSGGAAATITVTGLTVPGSYSAYIVAQDAAGNNSTVDSSIDISVQNPPGNGAPEITEVSVSDVRAASATLNLTSDDAGSIAAVALPAADPAPGSAADVKGHAGAIAGTAVAMTASTVSLTGLSAGTGYKAHFVVTNDSGVDSVVTSTDAFTTNNAPVADAGDGQSVAHNATVTLDGSGSSDADAGDTLEYAWAQTAGTTAALSDAAVASPTFDAGDASDAGETLTFELTVTDGKDSDTDTVDVVVAAVPTRPDLADASAAALRVGESAEIVFTNNGGGGITGCAASANVPDGLSAVVSTDMSTCRITGMPTTANATPVTVTVTATNAVGDDPSPATVAITVNPPIPMLDGRFTSTASTTSTVIISFVSDTNGTVHVIIQAPGGSSPTADELRDAMATDTGIISKEEVAVTADIEAGATFTGLMSSTNYVLFLVVESSAGVLGKVVQRSTITRTVLELREENDPFAFLIGRNYGDPSRIYIDIVISPDIIASTTIPLVNSSLTECTLVTVDGVTADASDPALRLPDDLTVGPDSNKTGCTFTGIPTAYTPLRVYGVIATDGRRTTEVAEIALKAATQKEPDFDIPYLVLERGVDYTAAPYVLTNRGGFVETCVDDVGAGMPTLPTGLSISATANGDTCQITGMAAGDLTLSSGGIYTGYAFNTDAEKGDDTRVQADYIVVEAAAVGSLAPADKPSGSRLRTFYSASSWFAYSGGDFDGEFNGSEVRFGAASTVTRCRLADDSPSLPYPFAVGPSSSLDACIIGPRAAPTSADPWVPFGPTDFTIIGSNSRGDATGTAAVLRLEAKVGTYSAPSLDKPTFPSDGTADKVVIPMGNTAITPIPIPNTGGKISGTWRHGCTVTTGALPTGLSVRIATAADAAAYNGASPAPTTPIEEGGTCVIAGTPGTAAAADDVTITYPISISFSSNNTVTFSIEVTAPVGG